MMCCLANVSGKVQGVFFRMSCQTMAIDMQISGYAKNLADGSVEVLMCGAKENVDKMTVWLNKGPETASVEQVECKEVPWQDHNHFSVE